MNKKDVCKECRRTIRVRKLNLQGLCYHCGKKYKTTIGDSITNTISVKEAENKIYRGKKYSNSNGVMVSFPTIMDGIDFKIKVLDRKNANRVAISGYFDPIHVGHIELIKQASELGDVIVILNNEEQAILKKGKEFMPVKERKIILEALEDVHEVVVSVDKDRTVCQTLKMIKPDIFANGGDRNLEEIPEAKICEEYGIDMVDGLGKKIQSSSNLTGIK